MGKLFGASWTTTLFGVLAAIFGGLEALPPGTLPVGVQGWLQFLFAAAIGGGLMAAKSYNVTNAPKPAEAAIVLAPDGAVADPSVPTRKMS
jgi:hypothetical protein